DAVTRINERYELGVRIAHRGEVERFHGRGFVTTVDEPVPIILLRAPAAAPGHETPGGTDETEDAVGEFSHAEADEAATAKLGGDAAWDAEATWPRLGWEHACLERATHPSLPRVLERFSADGFDYLVEEVPQGRSLWDAWDDPDATADQRFGWLEQLVLALQ